jgi:putative tryptophan/tyrosine transport system substrate-binding protein
MIRRREFIARLGSAAAAPTLWPLATDAQQPDHMRRVGMLMNGAATEARPQAYVKAFTESLSKAGWIEGKNISIVVRYNAGDAALARIFAAQLIGLVPDVILASSTTNLMMIREVTKKAPIVFTSVSDPIEQGFVASLAKPGGNITGFTAYDFSIGGKWLGLLKQIAPDLARIAVMFNPDTSPQSNFFLRSIGAAGSSLGIAVTPTPIRATSDIEPAIENFARQPNGGLILPTDSFTPPRFQFIAGTANRHRLPSLSFTAEYVKDGGLVYYGNGSDFGVEIAQGSANYVDRILKGERPGDLPVQNPTRYELVINMKTTKALGLTVALPLLALADEVIE